MKDNFDFAGSKIADKGHDDVHSSLCAANGAMIDLLKSASLGAKVVRDVREVERDLDFNKHSFAALYSSDRDHESNIGTGAVAGAVGAAIGGRIGKSAEDCAGSAVCEVPSTHIEFGGKDDDIYASGIGGRAIPALNPEHGGIWKEKSANDDRDPICHAFEIPAEFTGGRRR